jgi:carbon storage regulator
MLVLTRRKQEGIWIGPNIYVIVLAVQGGRVRLGFEAPRDVQIHRAELPKSSAVEERDFPNARPICGLISGDGLISGNGLISGQMGSSQDRSN